MSVLVDTSAWVEFLRNTGSPTCREVDRLLARRMIVTDPVVMEVLAGARNDAHLRDLRALLGRPTLQACVSADYLSAALLYRACRSNGETVRKLVDCLIAAIAIRVGVPLLHVDADFEVLARHTSLRIHGPG